MIQGWKVPHMLKGVLTWVPGLYTWRLRRGSTGGTDSPRYCYAVWLRHLVAVYPYGFRIKGAQVGELGPGDSIGAGLAALLSGAARYVGLDIVPFSAKIDLKTVFDELAQLFSLREPIPDHNEVLNLAIDWTNFADRVQRIRSELKREINTGQSVSYRAPWTSPKDIAVASLDLIFSQAVLEHVDALEETYQAMFAWLKPGGYASHRIDFSAHWLSPFWNGHWAYSDWQWRLVRGNRKFLLNREPLSTHLACAKKVGFTVLLLRQDHGSGGLGMEALSQRFQALSAEDVQTRGAMLILRKP
jgi:SAM-dependent methyltransferase